ncbi:hypothetical protein BV360_00299 [Pseudomonas syringae pv. actinidiae]|uniref:Uncharacterized protein n=1 Tax=Pseudomonas syringae pv. actinidiae TaxID=103796 RepID=M1JKJ3_PSESF|nr:hypothetical protein [Pseudomonas syringae pv. actinidiae]KPX14099.1 hypothetical protein ALO72_200058 [Pseudomonas syringae pv. delphinii]MBP1144447.1 hypothetical protein [Pseudomonas sp. PvP027]OSN39227.1 hypothetical protein BV343_00277 [Pseudomonas syringae pv. actinidiae]OSN46486.1 hypothetical protein BV344_00277 [Pseudomonas syringae pv. actinidiae]
MRSFYSKEKHCLLEKLCALENPILVQQGYLKRLTRPPNAVIYPMMLI